MGLAPDCFDVSDVANKVAFRVCNYVAFGVHFAIAAALLLAQEGGLLRKLK